VTPLATETASLMGFSKTWPSVQEMAMPSTPCDNQLLHVLGLFLRILSSLTGVSASGAVISMP